MSDNKMNGKDFVIGAVVGGILGAMAALLLAPKPGKELREDISGQYREVNKKAHKLVGDASQKTQKATEQVGSVINELAGKVKEMAGNVKNEIQSDIEVISKEDGCS
jgi:gas vesicle protein